MPRLADLHLRDLEKTIDQAVQAEKSDTITQKLECLYTYKKHGSVTRACKEANITRTTFYRWLERFESTGIDGLHDKRFYGRRPGLFTARVEFKHECGYCKLKWVIAKYKKHFGIGVFVVSLLCNVWLLLLPVATSASSWDPTLLVNTEAFMSISDGETGSDIELRFGDTVNETLYWNASGDQFVFTDDISVQGNINATGTISGSQLYFGQSLTGSGLVKIQPISDAINAVQVFDADGGNAVFTIDTQNERVGIGSNQPEATLEVVGTISGSSLVTRNINNSTSTTSGSILASRTSDAPEWVEPMSAMVWYIDGSVLTGTEQGATVVMPFGFTVIDIDIHVKTAPSGTPLQIDINENGSSIYSTNPEIDSGQTTKDGNEVLVDTILSAGSEVTLDVDQVGSSIGGADLTVLLKGIKRY